MANEEMKTEGLPEELAELLERIRAMLYDGTETTPEELMECAEKLLVTAEDGNSDLLYSWYYIAMLEYYNMIGETGRTEMYATEGLKHQEKAEQYNLMIRSYLYLGIAAEQLGDIEREVKHLLKGLDIALKHNLDFECCMVANNLSGLFYRAHEYDRAVYYSRMCEDKMMSSGMWDMDRAAYPFFLANAGNALVADNRLDEAEEERKQLLRYINHMKQENRKSPDFVVYTFFAFLDMKLGRTDDMRAEIEIAEADHETLTQCYMVIDDINLHLDVLEEIGEYAKVINLCNEFARQCREAGVQASVISDFAKRRALVADKLGDHEATLEAWREYAALVLSEEAEQKRKLKIAEKQHKELKAEEARQKSIIARNEQLQADIVTARNEAATKSAFISSVSHEIRTPINAILGMDEMIIRETTDENIRRYAYTLKRAGNALLAMINDILDFSKLDAGRMQIRPQEYELVDLVNGSVDMITTKAAEKHLELKVEIAEEIPHRLYGDDLRIKQIITNLLSNAVKYTDAGYVRFKMTCTLEPDSELLLNISVSDSGQGISDEDMKRILVPFERLAEDRNRNVEGTGLGLSIVQGLLRNMDSELKIESEYGHGSTFSFSVRQSVRDTAPVGHIDPNSIACEMESERKARFTARNASVLIVDDNLVNLEVASGLLRRTQMKIETASSGAESLEKCSVRHYDIILMDHRMPGMSGIEALHRIREESGLNRKTPVIALTANVESGLDEFYVNEGFAGYLSKPISAGTLETVVKKMLPDNLIDSNEDPGLALNEEAGVEACADREIFLSIVSTFVKTAGDMAEEIRGYLEKDDIEDYTIKVHALKSSARFVGAVGLSSEAAYLEQCGKENRKEEILKGTDQLLEHLKTVAARLGEKY